MGTIADNGGGAIYTAPQILPTPAQVTIIATSVADSSAQANATVTIKSDVMVSISPGGAEVAPGLTQIFSASVTGMGHPATGVAWSVNGVAGGNQTVGTIQGSQDDTAVYTAPVAPPAPPGVEVTATSEADPSRSATASVLVGCTQANGISPSTVTLGFGAMQIFTATLCVANGSGINWTVNGIPGGNSTVGTITPNSADSALYTAPNNYPQQNPVTIQAISAVDASETASASATITSSIVVSISPTTANVALGQRVTFTPTVQNAGNKGVDWSVNGVADGDVVVGLICVTGSNPCTPPAQGAKGSVDYLAPPVFPNVNPVSVTATSVVDPTKSDTAMTTLQSAPAAGLTIAPPYAFLAPKGQQGSMVQFIVSLNGSITSNVTWSLSSPSINQCTPSVCGTIDASGNYVAPILTPSPNIVYVTATSVPQPTLTATASVSLTTGALIQTLLPSSATAGIPYGFQLTVIGQNFVAGSGLGASAILINGNSRGADCPTSMECAITLQSSDVEKAGVLMVQVQNPGTPGPLSNPVPLVLIPYVSTANEISLSSETPFAAQQDIPVVDPTTSGAALEALTINFAGPLQDNGGNIDCTLQQSVITVVRPPSGKETVSLCVQGNGLDASMNFGFTGPADIGITATNLNGFLNNTLELDLTISSQTQPGLRSLFVVTDENDTVVATGLLEVE